MVEGINSRVTSPAFKGEQENKGSGAFSTIAFNTLAGAGAGYLMRKPISAEEIVAKYGSTPDEFVKGEVPKGKEEAGEAVAGIRDALKNKPQIQEQMKKETAEIFGEKTEVTLEEFLEKTCNAKTADEVTKNITTNKEALANLEKEYKELAAKMANPETPEILESLKKNADEITKKAYEHQIEIAQGEGFLKLAEQAKDGKITKKIVEEMSSKEFEKGFISEINELAEKAKELLPKDGMKKGLIGAAIGLGVGAVLAYFLNGKKEKTHEA